MKRLNVTFIVFVILTFCVGALVARGRAAGFPLQASSNPPSASTVVKPHIFVSLEPVPRGKEFKVAIVADIASGFHMNSHKPTDEYLIATTLKAELPAGFELIDTIYPKGKLEKFAFSPEHPLDVYSESVTLVLRLSAKSTAVLGPAEIPMTLRYQACNDSTCLPPVNLPLSAKFNLAEESATPKEVHPEIFSRLVPAR
jgi:cytochrome c biogenesis DsbD-like protein